MYFQHRQPCNGLQPCYAELGVLQGYKGAHRSNLWKAVCFRMRCCDLISGRCFPCAQVGLRWKEFDPNSLTLPSALVLHRSLLVVTFTVFLPSLHFQNSSLKLFCWPRRLKCVPQCHIPTESPLNWHVYQKRNLCFEILKTCQKLWLKLYKGKIKDIFIFYFGFFFQYLR